MKKNLLIGAIVLLILIGSYFSFQFLNKKDEPTPPATKSTEQSITQENTTNAGTTATIKDLTACNKDDCFYKIITRDKPTTFSFNDCKALDNKTADDLFKTDLGMLCRLVIARNEASFRKTDPCQNSASLNPDFDLSLKNNLELETYNFKLQEQVLKANKISQLDKSDAYNNSTIYNTYVYDYQTNEAKGLKRPISFATYVCITKDRHYTPYFYTLTVDDKLTAMDFVETPPVLDPIGSTPYKRNEEVKTLQLTN